MRQYSLCAVVKSGDEDVGGFIKNNRVSGENEVIWKYLSWEDLKGYIGRGLVSNLELNSYRRVVCRWSDETFKFYKSKARLKSVERDYLICMCQFSHRDIQVAFSSNNVLAVGVRRLYRYFGSCVCTLYLAGSECAVYRFMRYAESCGLPVGEHYRCIYRGVPGGYGYIMRVEAEVSVLERLLFNCSVLSLFYMDIGSIKQLSHRRRENVFSLPSVVSDDEINRVYMMWDTLTKRNLSVISSNYNSK